MSWELSLSVRPFWFFLSWGVLGQRKEKVCAHIGSGYKSFGDAIQQKITLSSNYTPIKYKINRILKKNALESRLEIWSYVFHLKMKYSANSGITTNLSLHCIWHRRDSNENQEHRQASTPSHRLRASRGPKYSPVVMAWLSKVPSIRSVILPEDWGPAAWSLTPFFWAPSKFSEAQMNPHLLFQVSSSQTEQNLYLQSF